MPRPAGPLLCLPTGTVSGQQLQPEEASAEAEEAHPVTVGPADEIVRPRPQGSSPVYECVAEGAGLGFAVSLLDRDPQEDTPSRHSSSGRRRSWWKRDSGDSRTSSRMSRPEEATEVTLRTEVDTGASGYSVTGGAEQGIFVKQVLKGSTAAKLFSLREGDQLLSTTIFFDDIKYEDALKILQYSEPYKVQFQIKRRLPAGEDQEWASSSAPRDPEDSEMQDKAVADGDTEMPSTALEGGGDQERLISKPREGRGRRPRNERVSWPKFQAIKPKRGPGPRRSHSSSEACVRGDGPDASPPHTDTEAQLPAEGQELKAGPDNQPRRRFLNLRFRAGTGKGLVPVGRPGREAPGGLPQAGVLEEAGTRGDAKEDARTAHREDRMAEAQEGPAAPSEQQHTEPSLPGEDSLGEGARVTPRCPRKTKEGKVQEETVAQGKPGPGPAPGQEGQAHREGEPGLETGVASLSLQAAADVVSTHSRPPEFPVRIPTLKTPKFGFSKEAVLDTEGGMMALQPERRRGHPGRKDTVGEQADGGADRQGDRSAAQGPPRETEAGAADRTQDGEEDSKAGDNDTEGWDGRMKTLRFKMPSFGWPPGREPRAPAVRVLQGREMEKGSPALQTATHTDGSRRPTAEGGDTDVQEPGQTRREEGQSGRKDRHTTPGDGTDAKDSKFKMPKFKMPSFGMSAPSTSTEASVDVYLPKARAEVCLPSIHSDINTTDLPIGLPSADLDIKAAEVGLKLPEGHVPRGELQEVAAGAGLTGHLPKLQMPSIKMPEVDMKGPRVDIKGPKLDVKGTKGEAATPDVEVSVPSIEVDIKVPDANLEGDLSLGDKEVSSRDSKFKMPKFKMPSFGMSAPIKDLETSVGVPVPKVTMEATRPFLGGELQASECSVQLPSADVHLPRGELEVALPGAELMASELKGKVEGAQIKAHLPKVQMPSIKMPKVDVKAPSMDIKGPSMNLKSRKREVGSPDVEVALPTVKVDIQVPDAKLEGDLSLGDKEVSTRDSKFKMPKFKMPSFGMSVPSTSTEASVDMSLPKAQDDVCLPSIQADVKTSDLPIELPSTDLDVKTAEMVLKLPEGHVPGGEFQEATVGAGLTGHLPKLQMPSIKMPKVDLKGPRVDIKGPKLDMKGTKGEPAIPDMEMDIQVPGAKLEGDLSLGDKEVPTRDSKFKMPKFKMPSFGVSAPSKDLETSVDVPVPKVAVEATRPSLGGETQAPECSVQLPSADVHLPGGELEVALPGAKVTVFELKGKVEGAQIKAHLPKVQMPSIKMPKVDIKCPSVDVKHPSVDIKGPSVDVKGPSMDVIGEVAVPSPDMDIQAPGSKLEGELSLTSKEVATRDSKFKMPKFKMPSFGVSVPSISTEASMNVSLPKAQAEVCLPFIQADVKASDHPIEHPSADLDVKTAEVGLKLPEGHVPGGELQEAAVEAGLTGHLPKLQMPSIKMPKVDFKGPRVDIKGPKLDIKGAKGEMAIPDLEVAVPSMEVDIQVPGAKLEGDLSLGDKEVSARHSKFKMPKFKMPSFGVSAPTKDLETSVDVPVPKVAVEATRPFLGGELQAPECSVQLPPADVHPPGGELEVALPRAEVTVSELKGKAEGAQIKAHLPKVQMPEVDVKAPSVDIKDPSMHMKGKKGEIASPDMQVAMPSMEVDTQESGAKLEGDLSLTSKEVAVRDSKFKMPKFKMPSFGVSAARKDLETSVDVSVPKVAVEATRPSLGGETQAPECSVQLPSADVHLPGGELEVALPRADMTVSELKGKAEGAQIKAHLPKVQMPSIKMPKVDIKCPSVDVKRPSMDVRGEVAVSSPDVDIQVPGAKLEGELSLTSKEVAVRDSKFKMPKFKMPSFGVSVPSTSTEASVDVSLPKAQDDVCLPSLQADVKTSDLPIELPSADMDVKTAQVVLKLPEGHMSRGELQEAATGAGLTGHLPKLQMPSIKMPKVDLKGPRVDIKKPKLDMKGIKGEAAIPDVEVVVPSMEVDIQVPGAKLEGDLSLGDKEVFTRDSKFKMPRFKMPSFSVSAPSKDLETSVDMPVPKVAVEATQPFLGGELQTPECSVQVPSADVHLPGGELEVALPGAEVTVSELKGKAEGAQIKGHLPKVQMPSIKMPEVDVKRPSVDLKGPCVAIKGPSVDRRGEVAVPSPVVDIQVAGAKLEGELSLASKEVAIRDSKFKMPKFKMPSFGMSVPSTSTEASVDVSLPKAQDDVCLPSLQADVKTSDLPIELPSADLDVKTAEVVLKLPEGHVPRGELQEAAAGAGLTGHLPKLQMPSIKMAKADIKGPSVDIKGPRIGVKCKKGEVASTDVQVAMPSMEVDIQVPGAKLERDLSLGDKEVFTRDSKFKMPKFKMPSFSVSAPSKDLETSVDVPVPKVAVEATRPFLGGETQAPECSVQLPSADVHLPGGELEVALPGAEVMAYELKGKAEGARIKAHLPKMQMPSIKMPNVDIKSPSTDIKGPSVDVREVAVPSPDVDIQVPGAKLEGDLSLTSKEVAVRDSKFKMPKFKMPSFGVSVPSTSTEASVDVSLTKAQAEVCLPSIQADIKTSDLPIGLPSADLDVKTAEVGLKLLEGHVPGGELQEAAAGAGLTGHLPKLQMPSIKMPKVDLKGPRVDIKGPKLDIKGAKGEMAIPDVEVAVPSMEVDIQVPGVKLEGDLSLGDKEVPTRDSKFKMPKFKMPSFGVSAPSKDLETSVDVPVPKVTLEATRPSLGGETQAPECSVQLPSADVHLPGGELEVALPGAEVMAYELKGKAEGARIKAYLPKVQMPSTKMPEVDVKRPSMHIKGPSMDVKGPIMDMRGEVALPRPDMDIQVAGAKLEGDLSLGDKEVSARHSKFKMPKFKMPSFGVSAPSKDLETSVDVPVPKVTVEATQPFLGGELQTPECSVQVPSADVHLPGRELEVALPRAEVMAYELKGKAEGSRIKAHLPKMQMPSIKMPNVDIKSPSTDIKGPSVDVREVAVPSPDVDIQVPGAKLEGDLSLTSKEVAVRDSKFKMPKFKMPSFGVSVPSTSTGASVDVSLTKAQDDVCLPSLQADVKTSDLPIELPSADLDVKTAEVGLKLPEGHVPGGELQEAAVGAGLTGHLPKLQMPSIKMPKVDLKDPRVDIKGPKLDVKGAKGETAIPDVEVAVPSMEVDIQVPGAKLEGDLSLGDKEVSARDSKFKMPKFKMPSFGVSAPSKDLETSVDVPVPKVTVEATRPFLGGELQAPECSVQLPSADVHLPGRELEVALPGAKVMVSELKGKVEGARIKAHLPKVQMPSIKMPSVDVNDPSVDIKGPSMHVKGKKGEVASPDMQVAVPSIKVDIQEPGAKLEGDLSLTSKEVAVRDSKFKMPKFKMPSFSVSAPSKDLETSVDVPVPKVAVEATRPSLGGETQAPECSVQLPSADVHLPGGELEVALPGAEVTVSEVKGKAEGARIKAHLPKVQMPSTKMPKMDFKAPSVDIKGPSVDLHVMEGEVTVPRSTVPLEVPLESPSVSQGDAPWPSLQGTPVSPAFMSILLSQVDSGTGPKDSPFPTSCVQVTFPKFPRPRFVFSVPRAGTAEAQPASTECALAPSPPSPVRRPDSSAGEATVFLLPSAGVSVSTGTEGLSGTVGTSAMASEATPAADAHCEGKGNSLKMPKLKLPSFRSSPKKGAGSREEPVGSLGVAEISLVVGPVPSDISAGVHAARMDAPPDVTPEKDAEKGVVCTPGFAGLAPLLPSTGAPLRGAWLLHTDSDSSLSSPPGRTESPATGTSSGEGAGDTGATAVPSDTAGMNPQPPWVCVPRLGLATPTLVPCEGDLPLPKHGLSLGDGGTGHGSGDSSARQPCGEATAPSTEYPLPPSCRTADGEGPAEGSPEWAMPAGSQESWHRMPTLHLPSALHSSEERSRAGGPRGLLHVPAAGSPREGVRRQDIHIPGPEVTTSLQSPEADVDVAAAESTSHAGVLRHSLDSRSSKLHLPPARVSASDPSTSEAVVCLGEGPLPLHFPQRRLPESYRLPREAGRAGPPGPAGQDLSRGKKGVGEWSSHPEGPLKLKVSTTDVPSQISIVTTSQLWEDSVLTVRFPRLKVPRLTYPVPGSEADIFIPAVREIQCPDSSLGMALQRESPGVWGASILKAGAGGPREQPVVPGLSSEASPISKVRVHIQGTPAESQGGAMCSTVAAEFAGVADPRAFSTQVVRESEIPASEVQTPAYGFSLLKAKIPEPLPRAGVRVGTPDSQLRRALQEAPARAAPGADPASGDLQSDTGEPFEMISSSVVVPGLQTCAFEVCSGHQFADSCSDEEPAEILECPPEDSQEGAPAEEGRAPGAEPESRRASGLFRLWLPNIGFSSSVDEKSAQSEDTLQRPEAGLPPRPEKTGWFRFPKLGFSSPTKKSAHAKDEAKLAEQKLQEEAATFFDAQDSFPLEEADGRRAEAAGPAPAPARC
ncbi:protein AHNAK2 isoform X2 [Manis javanica]|uniref:protein AHNAK2 isoform X2 n=1 Tax=Manis javanica TaxID=9974 RepID=UPI003C6D7AA8